MLIRKFHCFELEIPFDSGANGPELIVMKFRVIQSNDRGLVARVGDRTHASKGPARDQELSELPGLFIWQKKPKRLVTRCWIRWTGEKPERDYIYEVTRFRDVIDLQS